MQWKFLAPAIAALGLVAAPAAAQELTGTLKKIKDAGAITLGHRDRRCRSPITTTASRSWAMHGLCNRIVDAVKKELKADKLEASSTGHVGNAHP